MDIIRKLKDKGFFDIFGATVINSFVSFVYGIFIVRVLTKHDYGVFSYTQNILNFALNFASLGMNIGIIQFCTLEKKKQLNDSYTRFAANVQLLAYIPMVLLILCYVKLDQSNMDNLLYYTFAFSLLPLLFCMKEWISSILRYQLKNREYSIVLNCHSVCNALFAIIGAYLGGIMGLIFGIYLAYLVSIVVGSRYIKKDIRGIFGAPRLTGEKRNEFAKFSVTMCVVNALISVLFMIDIFVIGNILKDADQVAMYKTATLIPFALNMVPNAVMTFMYPHVAKNQNNKEWLQRNLKKLYLYNGVLNAAIGVALMICAPVLIYILFGESYVQSLSIFRVLCLSYIASSVLRTPSANLLGMLKKTKAALAISVLTVAVSVALGILFVTKFGIIGAAYGSVLTFLFVGILSFAYVWYSIRRMKSEN